MLVARLTRASTGTDSRPAQLFNGYERCTNMRVARDQVRREVQPESGRVEYMWRNLS